MSKRFSLTTYKQKAYPFFVLASTQAISKTLDVTRADDTSAGGDDDGKGKEQIVVKLRIPEVPSLGQ